MSWLLIVVTTFYASGSGGTYLPSVITFEDFKTQKRCEEIAKWINDTYTPNEKNSYLNESVNRVHAQCVPKD